MEKNIVEWEDQRPGFGLTCNQDFAKGEELKPKVIKFSKNFSIGRRGEQTSVTQTYHRRGPEEGAPGLRGLWGSGGKVPGL